MDYFETFTGIGGATMAMQQVFPKAECVGFSEKETHRIKFIENKFGHKSFGDITKLTGDSDGRNLTGVELRNKIRLINKNIPQHNVLIGGPPCKDLSIMRGKGRLGLQGKYSKLFYNYVDIIKYKEPEYFIMENVASMDDAVRDVISEILGCEPIMIDSSLVSAQRRLRYYWCNFPVTQPKDKKIMLRDILQTDFPDYCWIESEPYKKLSAKQRQSAKKLMKHPYAWSQSTRTTHMDERLRNTNKSNTLVTGFGCGSMSTRTIVTNAKFNSEFYSHRYDKGNQHESLKHKFLSRYLTVEECEQLQTYPIGYTAGLSPNQAYSALGDSFTVDVFVHLLNCLKIHMRKS